LVAVDAPVGAPKLGNEKWNNVMAHYGNIVSKRFFIR